MRHEHDIIVMLNAAKAPDLGLPLHRQRFVRALHARRTSRGARPNAFLTAFASMFAQRKLFVGGLAVLALVGVTALTPTLTAKAQAQGVAKRAIARFTALTPEQRAEIDRNIKADMAASLEEALRAPDLRILNKEEFQEEFSVHHGAPGAAAAITRTHEGAEPVEGGVATWSAAEPGTPAPEFGLEPLKTFSISLDAEQLEPVEGDVMFEKAVGFTEAVPVSGETAVTASAAGAGTVHFSAFALKEPQTYLRYTDSTGAKAALGLDEEGTPIMKIIALDADQMKMMKMIRVNHDGSTGEAGAIRVGGTSVEENVVVKRGQE